MGTVVARLQCQTLKDQMIEDLSLTLTVHTSMWGVQKKKQQFILNNRAKQVSPLVNQRDARSTALKHVWDDALSIPCNYCPSPPLHILSDHQEYFYNMNVKRVCVCGQEKERARGSMYTYHHHECKNPGGSPSVMFFSHRIWEKERSGTEEWEDRGGRWKIRHRRMFYA